MMNSSVHDVALHHHISIRPVVKMGMIRWVDLRAVGRCPAERGAAAGAAGAAALAADMAAPAVPLGVRG
eukprot:7679130-Pyramimonas_sp.AAC.1